jgi:hypothetical protein
MPSMSKVELYAAIRRDSRAGVCIERKYVVCWRTVRRGMLLTARAVNSAERAWLHQVLDGDQPTAARAGTDPPTLENPSADQTRR